MKYNINKFIENQEIARKAGLYINFAFSGLKAVGTGFQTFFTDFGDIPNVSWNALEK